MPLSQFEPRRSYSSRSRRYAAPGWEATVLRRVLEQLDEACGDIYSGTVRQALADRAVAQATGDYERSRFNSAMRWLRASGHIEPLHNRRQVNLPVDVLDEDHVDGLLFDLEACERRNGWA